MGQAQQALGGAGSLYSRQQRPPADAPDKTAGGALGAAAGMGLAGYTAAAASKGAMGGPTGAAIGAGVGFLAYLLS